MIIFEYLSNLSWFYGSTLMAALFVAVTILGIFLVRKKFKPEHLRPHHDVAGFVYTNLGVLYAVLLGFTVVNAQQRFDKIVGAVETEASYIAALYRDAEVYPDKNRTDIRAGIKHYTQCLLDDEWECMVNEKKSKMTEDALNALWKSYYEIDPSTPRLQTWYAESINKLNLLTEARLCRLLDSKGSLGPEMWSFLILGGISMVAFIWFFGLDNHRAHILMASVLAAAMGYLLFLIYSLDTTMSGSVSVSPDAINSVLKIFE